MVTDGTGTATMAIHDRLSLHEAVSAALSSVVKLPPSMSASLPADDDPPSSALTDGARVRRYVGSKNGAGVWQRIISEMPPHDVYVEPFLGTGAILQRKKPARYLSIGVDVDPAAPGLTIRSPGDILVVGDAVGILSALLPMMDLEWLVYCDPPYLESVRSYKGFCYTFDFKTDVDHRNLLTMLERLPCRVMLSGYDSALYHEHLKKWRCVRIPTVKRNGMRATECLWMNFPEPFSFHDTRYLGRNFRERERIKRKKQRWCTRLRAMSRIDRAAIIDTISELINHAN